jgi:activator of 2-hydroxyglutaryl-CoA dehydratase
MELPEPISFQGGVAANKGVVRAYREVFNLETLIIPEHFAIMPAIGVAFKSLEEERRNTYDLTRLKDFLSNMKQEETEGHEPLIQIRTQNSDSSTQKEEIPMQDSRKRIPSYLGIDVGSISTNLAVIDEHGRLLAKRYLMTAGRPIEAVRQDPRCRNNRVGTVHDRRFCQCRHCEERNHCTGTGSRRYRSPG